MPCFVCPCVLCHSVAIAMATAFTVVAFQSVNKRCKDESLAARRDSVRGSAGWIRETVFRSELTAHETQSTRPPWMMNLCVVRNDVNLELIPCALRHMSNEHSMCASPVFGSSGDCGFFVQLIIKFCRIYADMNESSGTPCGTRSTPEVLQYHTLVLVL